MTTCDRCGKLQALIAVDSPTGLAAWNRLHPEDQRSVLVFCSYVCVFLAGLVLGEDDVGPTSH